MRSVFVLVVPFSDDGQRILDMLLGEGIGVGVDDFPLRRNNVGNTVGITRYDVGRVISSND